MSTASPNIHTVCISAVTTLAMVSKKFEEKSLNKLVIICARNATVHHPRPGVLKLDPPSPPSSGRMSPRWPHSIDKASSYLSSPVRTLSGTSLRCQQHCTCHCCFQGPNNGPREHGKGGYPIHPTIHYRLTRRYRALHQLSLGGREWLDHSRNILVPCHSLELQSGPFRRC